MALTAVAPFRQHGHVQPALPSSSVLCYLRAMPLTAQLATQALKAAAPPSAGSAALWGMTLTVHHDMQPTETAHCLLGVPQWDMPPACQHALQLLVNCNSEQCARWRGRRACAASPGCWRRSASRT